MLLWDILGQPVLGPDTAVALQIPQRDTSHTVLRSTRDNNEADRCCTPVSLLGGDYSWAACFTPARPQATQGLVCPLSNFPSALASTWGWAQCWGRAGKTHGKNKMESYSLATSTWKGTFRQLKRLLLRHWLGRDPGFLTDSLGTWAVQISGLRT